MPIRDYKCYSCGLVKEIYADINDTSSKKCECGGEMKIKINPIFSFTKKYPKGHNLSATQRRELWNSDKIEDFRKIM